MFTENNLRFHNLSPTAAAEHFRPQVEVLGKLAVVYLTFTCSLLRIFENETFNKQQSSHL